MQIRPLVALLAAAFAAPLALNASAAVVISQVYGGGGNAGATLKNDFIELFNNGSTTVNLGGWSVQYASSSGTTWAATPLPAVNLLPGQYLLVQQAAGTGGTVSLPTPDATGTIGMGGSAGKVALSNSTSVLSGGTPAAQDLYSYSVGNNATAALRDANGCGTGFTNGTPNPRNMATALAPCSTSSEPPAFKHIYEIQGSGATSPLVNKSVTTEGVVTRLANTGFFMQALVGDGNPATSDGIFVYTGTAPTVAVNQLVRLSGTVIEFSTGGGTVTEITSPTGITANPGYSITPTPISLPVTGGLERYEGMLVTLAGPLTVGQNYFQARYGQVTLSAGGRLETPTNKYRPGSAQALALAADNADRMVVLEDGSSLQNVDPTPFTGPNGALRGGDTVAAITGVIDFGPTTAETSGPGAYRILPLDNAALQYTNSNPRTATPPAVGGNVKLASFNVLNYFTTFKDGRNVAGASGQTCLSGETASSSCRGANNADEFARQQAKIVAAISALDADALGLMEIQNNTVAAQNLVAALNAKVGAGTYAVAPGSAAGVVGSDAIKTTIIYKPAKLSPAGNSVIDNAAINNRPTVAQTFALANGQKFTLAVNHLKSKGSCPSSSSDPDADQGDGQGCYNATRVAQAHQLRTFVAQLQTSSGSNDVVLVGDFNAYGMENPITALTDNGYVDQIGRFNGFGYSYVFDGAAGRLDHAITTSSASAKVSAAVHWHINADESLAHDYNLEFKKPACATCAADPYQNHMYRSSDHDPVVMGLNLYNSYITAAGTTVSGTAGDDLITVGALKPTVTGGAGRDQFAFTSGFTGGATIADFTPGTDVINLSAVLRAAGVTAAAPLDSGHVSCVRNGVSDALIYMDPDAAGPAARRPLVLLKNVSCGSLNASSFQF
ncbi:MAG TPA: ExeM/NucH family extracellular endonuclease [Roseateles sp.]